MISYWKRQLCLKPWFTQIFHFVFSFPQQRFLRSCQGKKEKIPLCLSIQFCHKECRNQAEFKPVKPAITWQICICRACVLQPRIQTVHAAFSLIPPLVSDLPGGLCYIISQHSEGKIQKSDGQNILVFCLWMTCKVLSPPRSLVNCLGQVTWPSGFGSGHHAKTIRLFKQLRLSIT